MTDDEIQKMQDDLASALSSIKSLEKTNKDLKAEKAAAKKAADDAEEAREAAENDAATKSGDIEAVKAGLQKKHQAEINKLTRQLSDRDNQLSGLLIDNAISAAMTQNGVVPAMVPLVTAYLKSGVTIEHGEAMADGAPLADRISSYFSSQEARQVVAAPANTGGGAVGASRSMPMMKKPETAEEWSAFMQLALDNPAAAKAISDQHGLGI